MTKTVAGAVQCAETIRVNKGGMMELADMQASDPCGETRAGSIPVPATIGL